MNVWSVAVVDQSSAGVPFSRLSDIAAALQRQLDRDLAPAWGVRAEIAAFSNTDAVPDGTWPIRVVDDIGGGGGVHLAANGEPYAEAVNGDQLSLALSHELVEMLTDPWGNRFVLAPTIDPAAIQHQVFYLVEIADPCEVASYDIDGVQVSDFVFPSYYDARASGPVDFTGALGGPLTVPNGCYICWIDPIDARWHQKQGDGRVVSADFIAGGDPRGERDVALVNEKADRHNIQSTYRRHSWGS